jgi:hypothetical protein
MKLYEGVTVSQQIIGPGIKIALIASHLVNNENSNFVETAGYNRSIFIQYFHNKDTAMEWLLE